MSIDVIIEDPNWQDAGIETLATRAVTAVWDGFGYDGVPEVSVLACSDVRIAGLNADFRGKAVPTNVLSWPSEERGADRGQVPLPPSDTDLGDIAIAHGVCAREAAKAGISLADHVTHLVVHATLHLLGYDHIHDEDAALMEGLEVEILGKMGIADPYGDS